MAVACYDAAKISKQFSEIGSDHAQENYLQKAYYNSRTLDNVSYTSDALRSKTFELRSKNPIPSIYGKAKGGFQGFMYGLANSLPLIICSSFAILGKNILAKLGALGIGAIALYKLIRDGFGVGKNNPMR
jgi:hypothetical protein